MREGQKVMLNRRTLLRPWAPIVAAVGLCSGPGLVTADDVRSGPLTPAESLAKFKVPSDLKLDLLLSEPEIAQPVFVNFDERGRLWVVEYRQYPEPAGLKVLSRDGVWRIAYDSVPKAPPNHVRGLDRITIHEDTDGDGSLDKHTIFVDGLNIATACARGRGGVWVLNPPYLLFYPDRNNDDIPDGDPEVRLEGFGLEDTHSVVNSLCWGPDGWLYAAQGSTVSGKVKRPGSTDEPVRSMGQLIWRYHPESKRYEVFAEGGGNAFGVEIDSKGRIFSGHNGGNTRGFYYVQGGYSQKGFDKHGPLSNPYAFGYFAPMAANNSPRFTHAFVIEEGGSLPDRYRGKLLGVAPLLNHVVRSDLFRDGSSFRTRDLGYSLASTDKWFRPVDIKSSPDGSLVIADWYDGQTNHYRNHEGQIDRSNGRVYRLRDADSKPIQSVDLSRKSTEELVSLLESPNRWTRQTALRLIGDRKDPSIVPILVRMLREKTGQIALESLWALNLSGGFDEAIALESLDHADPYVRLWTTRLLGDRRVVSSPIAARLIDRARIEPDLEVRSQLACSARRLPASVALPMVRNLIDHDEDAKDVHIPLLIWWAIESKAASDREAVLALFRDPAIWNRPIATDTVIERLMRRFASSGGRNDLLACAELIRVAPRAEHVDRLMSGLELALSGRSMAGMPEELVAAMGRFSGSSTLLGLRLGRPDAVDEALRVLGDEKGDKARQLRYIQVLGEVDQPRAFPRLLDLARKSTDNAIQTAALASLRRFNKTEVSLAVLLALPEMTEDVRIAAFHLLASRSSWSLALLESIDAGKIDPRSIPPEVVSELRRHRDARLSELVRKHLGEPILSDSARFQVEIDRLSALIRGDSGDPRAGERLFVSKCATCHTLFGRGGQVGPDLTTFRREDTDTMLLSIVNPGAEIREGYAAVLVATTDGWTTSGVIVERDANVLVLRTADGREVSVRRAEIEEMTASKSSIMPEGLLAPLSDREVRDLFAYLRGSQPPK